MDKEKGQPFLAHINEPFADELKRVRHHELQDLKALQFAFKLECLEEDSFPNGQLESSIANKAYIEENVYYSRYVSRPDTASLGVVITDIEKSNVEVDADGDPIFYQFGPQRRELILAQRTEYFLQHQNERIYSIIEGILSGDIQIPKRTNRQHAAVEKVLGMQNGVALSTAAFSDLGYRPRSSEQELSRTDIALHGLFNRDGRRIIGVGSLPPASGWRDVVVTAILGHMPVFIPRNSLFADVQRRIDLIKQVQEVIDKLELPEERKQLVLRNIGVAVGTNDPRKELENVNEIYEETGVGLFRVYGINSDPRFLETARLIRDDFGDEVELWVGQIADRRQVEQLMKEYNGRRIADTIVYGHAAGRQCTSAANGMGITMLEDMYDIVKDPAFNELNIAVEGGVGKLVGIPLLLGADYVLYNQQLVHGTIEAGDLLLKYKSKDINLNGKLCQPYPGSASPTTQIIESSFEELRKTRTASAGRTTNPEGKPGFMFFERKANSMVFWIRDFLGYAARMLADLGVKDIKELRQFLRDNPKEEVFRIITHSTAKLAEAYRNS